MSCCGSSVVSAQTATSVAVSCDSATLHAAEPLLRSADSGMIPVDSETRSSPTSEDDNCSETASVPNPAEENASHTSSEDGRLDVYVKGDPATKTLKDCAYCQRVLLSLEEKAIPYTLHVIDPRHKPEWLLNATLSGHLPLVQDGDSFISESGKIAEFLEEKFPQPSLPVDEEGMSAGGGIFAAFRRFLLNKDASREADLHQRLEDELESMNQYLELDGGPFFGGSCFNAADIALLPRLYRVSVALHHFKEWQISEELTRVKAYLEEAMQRPSFQKTACSETEVIHSWKQHLLLDFPHTRSSPSSH